MPVLVAVVLGHVGGESQGGVGRYKEYSVPTPMEFINGGVWPQGGLQD